MISMIRGKVLEIGLSWAVLDVGGVGYRVYAAPDTLRGLSQGEEHALFTYLAVREDAMDLYGFLSRKDREMFELLISISGIGPKSALNIQSLIPSETLIGAVRTGSTAHLVKVSGIGRKTAEKIVLELRDKLGGMSGDDSGMGGADSISGDLDTIEALRTLGYDADEARDAMKRVSPDITDTGARIKAALKMLGKAR